MKITRPGFNALLALMVTLWSLSSFNSNMAMGQTRSLVPTIDPATKKFVRIRDTANRPCVTLHGAVRSGIVNPSEVSHIIMADNSCPKVIAIKACYYLTTRCVDFELRSFEKKQVLLGIMSAMPNFRFDFTERSVF